MDLPRIISVDDHIVEPRHLWLEHLPAAYRDRAPRVERRRGWVSWERGAPSLIEDDQTSHPYFGECDVWIYDDLRWPLTRGMAHAGYEHESAMRPVTYDSVLPGAFDQQARLRDMDINHTEVVMNYPTFCRFAGQTFLEREDKGFALKCLQAYNDFQIDELAEGDGKGRIIPLTIIPLWDPEEAAKEVRRCAAKGSNSVCFSELPPALGLPSLYSGHWEPFLVACDETGTVINLHIGSASKMPSTASDGPEEMLMVLNTQNSVFAFTDWMLSCTLVRFPSIKIVLTEGQVGWMPFIMQRMDDIWEHSESYSNLKGRMPNPPSTYVAGRIYGCIFNDQVGLKNRDTVGMSQIMFETDYPHADSTFPHSKETALKMVQQAGLDEHEAWQLVRGNAIECYNLGRWGITA